MRKSKKPQKRRDSGSYHLLWHQFLRLSPSYFLAYQVRTGERSYDPALNQGFPSDFERVLKVYDVFGDVYHLNRDQWSEKIKSELPAPRRSQAKLRVIARYDRREEKPKKKLAAEINDYFSESWVHDGRPNFVLISLPPELPINTAIDQLREEMQRARTALPLPRKFAHTFPLASPRLQERTLLAYLRMIYFHAAVPRAKLWQVGARAGFLPSAGSKVGLRVKATAMNRDERNKLAVLASRAHSRSNLVAENAARGLFPSIKPCTNALPQDWKELQKRIVWYISKDKMTKEKETIA
jgi:hypothetical protein